MVAPDCDAISIVCSGCHGDQSRQIAAETAETADANVAVNAVFEGVSNDIGTSTSACRGSLPCPDWCRRPGWSIGDLLDLVYDLLDVVFDLLRLLKTYSLASAAFCAFFLFVSVKFRKRILLRLKRDLAAGRLLAQSLWTQKPVKKEEEREEHRQEEEKKEEERREDAEEVKEKQQREANGAKEQRQREANGGTEIQTISRQIAPVNNMTITDEDGHMIIRKGDILQSRFEIIGLLGEGTFGKVAEVRDSEAKNKKRALKVIRNIDKYREAAKLEIQILETIAEKEETVEGRNLCLTHVDWFGYNGHICLAFELLGESVFDFLKDNEYQPYTIEHTRHIMFQLISAVAFLHRLKITHTDLKPENLLFKNRGDFETLYTRKGRAYKKMRNTEVRLIDFGSATFDHDHHSTVVSTRHYRAPEVVLELGWSIPCDIWSIGCILFELCQGATMFQTHENKEHLAMMEQILGPIPYGMIKKTPKTKYFWRGRLDWDDRNEAGLYVKRQCRPLKENLGPSPDKDSRQMYDLMELMLEYNPDQRLSAEECLKHGFFEQITQSQRLTARASGVGPSTKIH